MCVNSEIKSFLREKFTKALKTHKHNFNNFHYPSANQFWSSLKVPNCNKLSSGSIPLEKEQGEKDMRGSTWHRSTFNSSSATTHRWYSTKGPSTFSSPFGCVEEKKEEFERVNDGKLKQMMKKGAKINYVPLFSNLFPRRSLPSSSESSVIVDTGIGIFDDIGRWVRV